MSRTRMLVVGAVAVLAGGAMLAFMAGQTSTIAGTAVGLAGVTLLVVGWGRCAGDGEAGA